MNTSKLIRTLEEQLTAMNLPEEEKAKQLRTILKKLDVEQVGFRSDDIELPEGAILIGVHQGEVVNAKASKGQLWVEGEPFNSIGGASFKATGVRTLTGWNLWKMAYIPRVGIKLVKDLRLSDKRAYNPRPVQPE
jgi:hypothetical protein